MVFFISYVPVLATAINISLQEKVKTYKDVLLLSNNTFLIATEDDIDSLEKVKQIRNELEEICGQSGAIFVGEMGEHAAWYGYNGEKIVFWLSKYINKSKNVENFFDPNQNKVQNGTEIVGSQHVLGNDISQAKLEGINFEKKLDPVQHGNTNSQPASQQRETSSEPQSDLEDQEPCHEAPMGVLYGDGTKQ